MSAATAAIGPTRLATDGPPTSNRSIGSGSGAGVWRGVDARSAADESVDDAEEELIELDLLEYCRSALERRRGK